MLTYVGTRHTCRRLSLNETATAFQADRVAFCKQTDFMTPLQESDESKISPDATAILSCHVDNFPIS